MRQFLAIELSEAMRERLAAVQRRLRGSCAGWRWVRAEAIHLTVRFLGEVSSEDDERCRTLWRERAAAATRFELRLGELGCFPPRGRPRVLWVGASERPAGALLRLAEEMESAAREAGFSPEDRPFRAHLTLARASRAGRPEAPQEGGAVGAESCEVDAVTLFRSELRPDGARYTALERFHLGGAA